MARFRLKTPTEEYPLAEGETILGRGAECDIKLDNPLASRRHARLLVKPDGVTFEDLGSTHGSRINGEPMRGSQPLFAGDRITIGIVDFVLMAQGDKPPDETTVPEAAELAPLVSRLCARGRIDDAERIALMALERLKQQVHAGEVLPVSAVADAVERSLVLAEATRAEEWARAVFETATLVRHLFEDKQLDRIYGVLFVARPGCADEIDRYLQMMRPLEAQLNEKARYNLRRVEALRKLTTAPASR